MKTKIDIKELMLPHIRSLEPYKGVRPMEAMAKQAGISAEKVIRLNGNENPYGPSPKAVEALGNFQNYNHYPDPDQRKLREVLSGYVEVPPEQIVAGNGSDEIIDLLMRMFLGPGENIVIPSPTFGMYAVAAGINAGEAIAVQLDENFEVDLEAMRLAITPKTKGFFIPSPNNPTGNLATEAQIRGLLDTGLLVVVDEAYYEFLWLHLPTTASGILKPGGHPHIQQVGRTCRAPHRPWGHATRTRSDDVQRQAPI